MKKFMIAALLSTSGMMAFAQAEFDALRLTQSDITGTARFVGMSGAFGALGGDMSALRINPAGIGVYRSSEFSLTPAFQSENSKADLNSTVGNANKSVGLINGFGYVGSFRTYDESAISNFNFAITYNRVADFNRNTTVKGTNRATSLLDKVCSIENQMWYDDGTHPDHTTFYNYLNGVHVIGLNTAGNAYVSPLSGDEKLNSEMNLEESGRIDSWNLTLGANYNHTFYIGVGLGIQTISYDRQSAFSELYQYGGGTSLRNVLSTSGSGVDFKAGIIYKPVPELRLGFSFNSGTYYALTDVFNASMASNGFRDPITDQVYSPNPVYEGSEQYIDYILRTPWQMTMSAAYQFGNRGLLSMDVEYIDYRNTTLMNASGFELTDINDYMTSDFQRSYHFRMGAESRISDNLSVRMGAAYYMSPVNSNLENLDIATAYTRPDYSIVKNVMYASIGAGYRSGPFFLDGAIQERISNEHFFNFCDLSSSSDAKYAQLTRDKINLVFTAGYKF